MKRKVSDLPPLSAEDFDSRVMQARQAEQVEKVDPALYCKACKKFFKTKNSHDNHLNSKKHKECLKDFLENHVNENDREDIEVSIPAAEEIKNRTIEEENNDDDDDDDGMDIESVDSDEWIDGAENPIKENDCLFCVTHSESLEKNLQHMSIAHSFFIPDLEYCIDIEGLVAYLAEKVGLSYICLWCNEKGKTFYSLRGVRGHMNDKGHTIMLHEGAVLAEYAPFYDYSSSYPDHDESKNIDEEVDIPVLDGDAYSLVLPSGNVIGHRSLMRYYKQHLNPNRVIVKKSDKVKDLLSHYRAIGYTAKTDEIARRAKDIHAMKRTQAKLYMQLGCKSNKLQKHFRAQVNF